MLLAQLKMLLEISKAQLKLGLLTNSALAALLCLLTPVFFGIRYLDAYSSSFVLERFVGLTGIILLTPIFYPEQDKSISEVVSARVVKQTHVMIARLTISLLNMALCIIIMVIFMRLRHCEFDAVRFFAGTYVTAFTLGALGIALYGITNNIAVGYLAALSYYLLNFAMGSKLKMFYLFSLASADFAPKYILVCIASALVLAALTYRHIAVRHQLFA